MLDKIVNVLTVESLRFEHIHVHVKINIELHSCDIH